MKIDLLKSHLKKKYQDVFHREEFINNPNYLEVLVNAAVSYCHRLTGHKPEDILWDAGKDYPGEKFENLRYAMAAGRMHTLLALPRNYLKLKNIVLENSQSSEHQAA